MAAEWSPKNRTRLRMGLNDGSADDELYVQDLTSYDDAIFDAGHSERADGSNSNPSRVPYASTMQPCRRPGDRGNDGGVHISMSPHDQEYLVLARAKPGERRLGSSYNPIAVNTMMMLAKDLGRNNSNGDTKNRMTLSSEPSHMTNEDASVHTMRDDIYISSVSSTVSSLTRVSCHSADTDLDNSSSVIASGTSLCTSSSTNSNSIDAEQNERCSEISHDDGLQLDTTALSRGWIFLCKMCTCFIPNAFIPRPDPAARHAWREKVTTAILLLLISVLSLGVLVFLPDLICHSKHNSLEQFTLGDINEPSRRDEWTSFVAIFGFVYNATSILENHPPFPPVYAETEFSGRDVSHLFARIPPWHLPPACLDARFDVDNSHHHIDGASLCSTLPGKMLDAENDESFFCHTSFAGTKEVQGRLQANVGKVVFLPETLGPSGMADGSLYVSIDSRVYNVTSYISEIEGEGLPMPMEPYLAPAIHNLIISNINQDATENYHNLFSNRDHRQCLDELFYVGNIYDPSSDEQPNCRKLDYIKLPAIAVIVTIVGLHLLCSLIHASRPVPNLNSFFGYKEKSPYLLAMIPCYAESYEELKRTLDSLIESEYDNDRLTLVLVVDGIVSGNNAKETTPMILSRLLGFRYDQHKAMLSELKYNCVSDAFPHNCVSLHAGIFQKRHGGAMKSMKYVVVTKQGCSLERNTSRAGNRGKRDSQLLLLGILNRIASQGNKTSELDRQFRTIFESFGVPLSKFQYLLTVDADTRVAPDAIPHMIYQMERNDQALACCGETQVENSNQSWVTMIQVFEYFTSHHLKKAFESVFGCVTCLPGCFSIYRLYMPSPDEIGTRDDRSMQQLLCHDIIYRAYGKRNLQSLHEKNLFELGEDRMLTTLLLKHFPDMQLVFVPEAICWTTVPHNFSILLSQRRRWINSTLHNMLELLVHVRQMCGCCCCSMKLIVFFDLIGAILSPAFMVYTVGFLIPALIQEELDGWDLVMLFVLPSLLIVPFLFRAQWEYAIWLLLYLLVGTVVFFFILPIYAVLHMDNLNWGKTCQVQAEEKEQTSLGCDTKKQHNASTYQATTGSATEVTTEKIYSGEISLTGTIGSI